MGWKQTGDERVKSYKVYKDLEAQYLALHRAHEELQDRLRAKDETLRQMARELFQALGASTPSTREPATETPERPTVIAPELRKSDVVAKPAGSLRDILGNHRADETAEPKRKEG